MLASIAPSPLKLSTLVVFAALLPWFATPRPSGASDTVNYLTPRRTAASVTAQRSATLLAYTPNLHANSWYSPYVLVRFDDATQSERVYLLETSTLNGAPFNACPPYSDPPFRICAHLPAAIETTLPRRARLTVWRGMLWGEDVWAAESVTLLP